jgi:hypothetical protein
VPVSLVTDGCHIITVDQPGGLSIPLIVRLDWHSGVQCKVGFNYSFFYQLLDKRCTVKLRHVNDLFQPLSSKGHHQSFFYISTRKRDFLRRIAIGSFGAL